MIFLIGGAPRTGKSILLQRVSARLGIGWASTDLLLDLLRAGNATHLKSEWNAAPEAIRDDADRFFPYLERFIRGATSLAENYIIEGVDFLRMQVAELSTRLAIRPLFLGRSQMTLETLERFPGRSHGYSALPEDMRRQIVSDVPRWSEFIRGEAQRWGQPYLDTAGDFARRLDEAEAMLTRSL